MYTLMLCVATAAVGIDVGWQRMPEGGMEYIIQLDSQTLEALRAGEDIRSEILPGAGEVRGYRIIVGGKKPPRETPPAPSSTPKTTEPKGSDHRESQPKTTSEVQPEKPATPWLLTLLGLFASLGVNGYLGWIAWDARQRWQALRSC